MRKILPLCLLAICSVFAQDANSVGEVIAVEGLVKAGKRILARESSIFLSDVITTSQDGKAQLKFTDGSIANLIENTEFRVDRYVFNKPEDSVFFANLLKGGFRAVSGEIGKLNPEKYSIDTPSATIGIRGTLFTANIVEGSVYFGVDEGSITITNNAGSLTLEAGQYVRVISREELGAITEIRPEELGEGIFAAPVGGAAMEAIQTPIEINPEITPMEAPTEGVQEEAPEEGVHEQQMIQEQELEREH